MVSATMTTLVGLLSPGGKRGRLSTLIYHRVVERDDPLVPWALHAEDFSLQMATLHRHFNVIPLSEALERLAAGTLPPRAAAVTFDDGYRDNLTVALPILKQFEIPATIFVASGYLDGGRMWNDTVIETVRAADGSLDLSTLGLGSFVFSTLEARVEAASRLIKHLKYLPHQQRIELAKRIGEHSATTLPHDLMLSCEEVRVLHASGIEIGGHTLSHPILAGLDEQSARYEIVENRARLSEITGVPPRIFAYPNGRPGQDYTEAHVRMVRESGYFGAVSTATGVATTVSDPYQLPRFTPWDRQPTHFTLRLMRNLLVSRVVRV